MHPWQKGVAITNVAAHVERGSVDGANEGWTFFRTPPKRLLDRLAKAWCFAHEPANAKQYSLHRERRVNLEAVEGHLFWHLTTWVNRHGRSEAEALVGCTLLVGGLCVELAKV